PAVLMAATMRLLPQGMRGIATGIVNAGGSFGQFAMAPIAGALMIGYGWSIAMQVLGAIVLLALPAAFLLRGNSRHAPAPATAPSAEARTAAARAPSARTALGEAARDPSYRLLAAGFF